MKTLDFKLMEATVGGIRCDEIEGVLDYLWDHNFYQWQVVAVMWFNNQIQCN